MTETTDHNLSHLPEMIGEWARELGFSDVGITHPDTGPHAQRLQQWLDDGFHGEMGYMADHGDKRYTPRSLVDGTRRVISVRLDYRPEPDSPARVLTNPEKAYITRYAVGRDYHKLMRKRLAALAKKIDEAVGGYDYRAFVDSAPVLERALAQRAGLGWIGIALLTGIPEVQDLALTYLPYAVAFPIVSFVAFVMDGVFLGATQNRLMRHAMLMSMAVYLAALYLTQPWGGNDGLWLCLLLFFSLRGITLWLFWPRLLRGVEGG